jgi:ABC-type transport system involved in multi-copper enzyme maturation permease subunit
MITFRPTLVIAALTLREIVRRRIVWVLLILAVVSVVLVGIGVQRLVTFAREDGVAELEIRIGVSQVLIMIAFMFSFVLAMSAAFLAAPAIASDVETGTVLAMLARPIRRADLVVGRWLGLSIAVAIYAVVSGLLAIAAVNLVSGHLPPSPFLAVAYLAWQAITVLTLALALGTRLPAIAAGAITVVVFGLGWFVGVLGSIAIVFNAEPLARAADALGVVLPTDGLWRGVIYGLEPPLVTMLASGSSARGLQASPFFSVSPPPLTFVVWSVVWVALVVVVGVLLFRRREL